MTEPLHGDAGARPLRLLVGPLACALVLLLEPGGLSGAALRTLAITAWVAAWWVLEALPIPATSLLPLALLPLFGVMPAEDVARLYMGDLLILLLAGFLLALAIERWGLHRRIAIAVLARLGGSPRLLVLGFALAAAVISMWISNSATTLVLLPIALAVCRRLERDGSAAGVDDRERRRTDRSLLLAVAYGATAGGLGTYVGTPPNLVFRQRYAEDFGAGTEGGPSPISFPEWMVAFAPLAVLLALVIGLVLAAGLERRDGGATRAAVREEAARLPAWCAGERLVAALFACTALLWITRERLELGERRWFGWAEAWWAKGSVTDATVAITLLILAFTLRAKPAPGMTAPPGARTVPLLEWREAESKMPWGVLLLFGAGFALGQAFHVSGLGEELGRALADGMEGASRWALVLVLTLSVILISEFMNNTACAQVILPILAAVAPRLDIPAPTLLVAATLASSCGFMMPAGTAPNAIVFATGRIRIAEMVRVGIVLDLLSAALVTAWILAVAPRLGVP